MNASSRLPQFHIVGFTGHRQLAQTREIQGAVRAVLDSLRREGPGEWIALSSAAAGADMLFAQEALEAGLAWHVVLPLPPAEFRKDFSTDEWKRVETLLPMAEQVRVIAETGSRDDAYLDAGMEVVHECDVLLAVWDGQPPRGKGGTAEVVAYARELNKPTLIIDTATGGLRREHFKEQVLV